MENTLEELKRNFIEKWSCWFIFKVNPSYEELKQAFEKELDEIINYLQKEKPKNSLERPKIENFFSKGTTPITINNMLLKNKELYNYIIALDSYIDEYEK